MVKYFFVVTAALLLIWTLRASGDENVAVNEILESVRANERLYDNVEIELSKTLEMTSEQRKYATPDDALSIKETVRLVFQDGMYYKSSTARSMSSAQKRDTSVLQGFDGTTVRAVYDNKIVNLERNPSYAPRETYKPHTILWITIREKLSTFLLPPGGHKEEKGREPMECRLDVDGFESLDGVMCVKLKQFRWNKTRGEDKGSLRYVWLAVERSYIPAKTVDYRWFVSKSSSTTEASVSEWAEVAPGLWYPAKAEIRIYDDH